MKEIDSEKELDELRGDIINRLNVLEKLLIHIISGIIKPHDKKLFNEIIMNNSVVSIGGKIKILKSIEIIDDKTYNQLMRLLSIRNGFAHSTVKSEIETEKFMEVFALDLESEDMLNELANNNTYFITTMNSNGGLKEKNFHELYEEYTKLEVECFKTVFELWKQHSGFMGSK